MIKYIFFGLCLFGLTSCVSLLPVNNHYEKAGTLQNGNIELAGHATRYDVNHFGRTEASNRNYGFRAGYGFTDRFDLKLRYERLSYTSNFDNKLVSAHHFSIMPKYALVPEYFSVMLAIGNYSASHLAYGNPYKSNITSIAPQMIFTMTNRKKQADVSLSTKLDFLFTSGDEAEHNMFFGTTLGAGFSKDLRKWAIRPEIGYATDLDAHYFSYGIGLQLVLPTNRKK